MAIFAQDRELQTNSEKFKETFFYNDLLSAGGFTYQSHKGESCLRKNENPNDICYNSNCLISNLELLFGLGSDLARIVGTAERNMFTHTLSNLKERKSVTIGLEELSQIMSDISGYFFSILKQDYEIY